MDAIYEIRICSIYNDLISCWSEIKEIKTSKIDYNCDSLILEESKRKNEFLDKIYGWCPFNKIELIFRGSRDGLTSNAFHNKCDGQGPTITLYQNEKGYIFGGYSSISWENTKGGQDKSAPGSFIFTLTNIHGAEPTKFPNSNINKSVYHYDQNGPVFGHYDILIYSDFKNREHFSNFPLCYQDTLNKGKSIFTGDLNNNNQSFKIKEIEVFKFYKL